MEIQGCIRLRVKGQSLHLQNDNSLSVFLASILYIIPLELNKVISLHRQVMSK